MNRQPMRRYQIWALAKDAPGERRNSARSFLIGDEDDGSSLYHYGLPIEIQLPGHCILPNGRSTSCKTKKISSESVSFIYDLGTGGYRFKLPDDLPAGSVMNIDLDRIGEFHGALTSQYPEGFQIAVDGEYKDMLSKRLALLATTLRNIGLDDGSGVTKPSITRIEPDNKNCRFTDQVGRRQKRMADQHLAGRCADQGGDRAADRGDDQLRRPRPLHGGSHPRVRDRLRRQIHPADPRGGILRRDQIDRRIGRGGAIAAPRASC